jgi:hypothetical protein
LDSIDFIIVGAGSIPNGVKGVLITAFSGTFNEVTLLADEVGDIEIEIWKAPYSSYAAGVPNASNKITGTNNPAIVGGIKYKDTVLSTWTTSFNKDDVLAFYVVSSSCITQCTVSLFVQRAT